MSLNRFERSMRQSKSTIKSLSIVLVEIKNPLIKSSKRKLLTMVVEVVMIQPMVKSPPRRKRKRKSASVMKIVVNLTKVTMMISVLQSAIQSHVSIVAKSVTLLKIADSKKIKRGLM